MTIFQTIGLAWVVFTSALATVQIIYLAFIGFKAMFCRDSKESEVPVEVKEMFKIAR
jgi:hypothetical protein